MGKMGLPFYGENIGDTIQTAKAVIAKIESNKFDEKDLLALIDVLDELKTAVEHNVD